MQLELLDGIVLPRGGNFDEIEIGIKYALVPKRNWRSLYYRDKTPCLRYPEQSGANNSTCEVEHRVDLRYDECGNNNGVKDV